MRMSFHAQVLLLVTSAPVLKFKGDTVWHQLVAG